MRRVVRSLRAKEARASQELSRCSVALKPKSAASYRFKRGDLPRGCGQRKPGTSTWPDGNSRPLNGDRQPGGALSRLSNVVEGSCAAPGVPQSKHWSLRDKKFNRDALSMGRDPLPREHQRAGFGATATARVSLAGVPRGPFVCSPRG